MVFWAPTTAKDKTISCKNHASLKTAFFFNLMHLVLFLFGSDAFMLSALTVI